jgi:hypothetical protein
MERQLASSRNRHAAPRARRRGASAACGRRWPRPAGSRRRGSTTPPGLAPPCCLTRPYGRGALREHRARRALDPAGGAPREEASGGGRALTGREKAALRLVPEQARQAAIDSRGKVRERRADDACGNSQCAHRPCRLRGARSASGQASRVASPLLPFPWPTRPGGSPGPGPPPRVDHRYATP